MRSNSTIFIVTLTVLLAVATSIVASEAKPSTKSKVLSGKELLDKNGCLNCHFVNGEGGFLGPLLSGIKEHRSEAYIIETLTNGASRQFPDRYYPKGVLDPREYMRHVKVGPSEARKIARYLLSLPEDNDIEVKGHVGGVASPTPPGFSFQPMQPSSSSRAGLDIYKDSGCMACHSIAGVGGRVGPSLDGVGARRTRAFIENRIALGATVFFEASAYKPSKYSMPPADLSQEDIQQITDFLLTLPVRNQKSKKPISP